MRHIARRRRPIDFDLAALATGGTEALSASLPFHHRRLLRFNGPHTAAVLLQIYPDRFIDPAIVRILD